MHLDVFLFFMERRPGPGSDPSLLHCEPRRPPCLQLQVVAGRQPGGARGLSGSITFITYGRAVAGHELGRGRELNAQLAATGSPLVGCSNDVLDKRAASSRLSTSARDGAEYHACPRAEPERARDYRYSWTRSRPKEDSGRCGTAGSDGDGSHRTPERHARGTGCAVPGDHDRQRADNGRRGEPEISEVIACVDGTDEPKEHRHARKEHRHEQQQVVSL